MEILLNLKHHETYGNFISDEQLKPLLDKYAATLQKQIWKQLENIYSKGHNSSLMTITKQLAS